MVNVRFAPYHNPKYKQLSHCTKISVFVIHLRKVHCLLQGMPSLADHATEKQGTIHTIFSVDDYWWFLNTVRDTFYTNPPIKKSLKYSPQH